jgi:hypothetical protein
MKSPVDPGSDRSEILVLWVLAAVAGLGLVVWLTGQLAALLRYGRWPAVSAAAVGTVLVRLPTTLRTPRNAWPPTLRPQLPVGIGW